MMAKAKHIPLFADMLDTVELMSDEDLGSAIRAAMRYMASGEDSNLTGCAGMMYQMLRAQFVRQQGDVEAGKRGGRPPKTERGVFEIQTPVSESETIKRNVTEQDVTEQTEQENVSADKPPARARFVKPTLDEVTAYCTERQNSVDPERFLNYYEANGWRVGKNPMKDWRAAVRTWEQREGGKPHGTDQGNATDYTAGFKPA